MDWPLLYGSIQRPSYFDLVTNNMNHLDKFLERYGTGHVPWDDPLPPPEIIALADGMSPGRMLDLGCGYGRTGIYLAERGWTVVGVDFVPLAIETARRRAHAAGVSDRAQFHVASATELDFLTPYYDLAIDIGCMHSFTEEMLRGYKFHLDRLLAQGGRYILFAHLRDEDQNPDDEGPRGIPEAVIMGLFEDNYHLERVERGVTQVEDRPPWNSGWFWFRRL